VDEAEKDRPFYKIDEFTAKINLFDKKAQILNDLKELFNLQKIIFN